MDISIPSSKTWLVTGAAGFIGSHLLEKLLLLDQRVVALDNFATGSRINLDLVRQIVGDERWSKCSFFELDIRDREGVELTVKQHRPDIVLHQAALGSVPRSLDDPLTSHQVNVDGFITVLEAVRKSGVKRFVYASSSAVYGDLQVSPKREDVIGNCLSPYAATKRINEIYAQVYGRSYGLETIGLRYFNVFGPRQDPNGPYAAVVPRWLAAMSKNEPAVMYGDGSTSRDFCFVANVVQANIAAGLVSSSSQGIMNSVANIACGATTSLQQMFDMLRRAVATAKGIEISEIPPPRYEPFRQGDIKHSLADITRAQEFLDYRPTYSVEAGIRELVQKSGTDATRPVS
jgi:UDP-N-acetylglucosamine 4-epimerase